LPLTLVVEVATVALLVLAWRACSVPEHGYFEALKIIASSMMSGCFNISVLYVPFVVLFAIFASVAFTLIGLVNRLRPATVPWLRMVTRFNNWGRDWHE
jgi:hypothetical protein